LIPIAIGIRQFENEILVVGQGLPMGDIDLFIVVRCNLATIQRAQLQTVLNNEAEEFAHLSHQPAEHRALSTEH
jgi:hypothetical protein